MVRKLAAVFGYVPLHGETGTLGLKAELIGVMAQKETHTHEKRSLTQHAKETQIHIKRIRAMLLSENPSSENPTASALLRAGRK